MATVMMPNQETEEQRRRRMELEQAQQMQREAGDRTERLQQAASEQSAQQAELARKAQAQGQTRQIAGNVVTSLAATGRAVPTSLMTAAGLAEKPKPNPAYSETFGVDRSNAREVSDFNEWNRQQQAKQGGTPKIVYQAPGSDTVRTFTGAETQVAGSGSVVDADTAQRYADMLVDARKGFNAGQMNNQPEPIQGLSDYQRAVQGGATAATPMQQSLNTPGVQRFGQQGNPQLGAPEALFAAPQQAQREPVEPFMRTRDAMDIEQIMGQRMLSPSGLDFGQTAPTLPADIQRQLSPLYQKRNGSTVQSVQDETQAQIDAILSNYERSRDRLAEGTITIGDDRSTFIPQATPQQILDDQQAERLMELQGRGLSREDLMSTTGLNEQGINRFAALPTWSQTNPAQRPTPSAPTDEFGIPADPMMARERELRLRQGEQGIIDSQVANDAARAKISESQETFAAGRANLVNSIPVPGKGASDGVRNALIRAATPQDQEALKARIRMLPWYVSGQKMLPALEKRAANPDAPLTPEEEQALGSLRFMIAMQPGFAANTASDLREVYRLVPPA